jgi:hypothetical protein
MKKTLLLCFATFTLLLSASGQITKGYWLLSGSAGFSSLTIKSAASIQLKQTDIQLSGSVGHFIFDKFAAGIRPSLSYGSNNITHASTVFNIGPFVRYYLLRKESTVNILADAGYLYGTLSGNNSSNTYTVSIGPVVYFNTSVGLEFLIGYSTTKIPGYDGSNNKIQVGVGFQFHLEKEK